jgi:hypothetical protein
MQAVDGRMCRKMEFASGILPVGGAFQHCGFVRGTVQGQAGQGQEPDRWFLPFQP